MTRLGKIQIGLVVAAGLVVAWQVRQHQRQARELGSLQVQAQAQAMEFESRRATLVALEQRNQELAEAERRAGNETLLSLLRERNAATLAAAPAASEAVSFNSARHKLADNPEQREADRDYMRNEMRANMGQFFKLAELTPEKIEEYINAQVEMERRKAERLSALRQGKLKVADALRDRDVDEAQWEKGRGEMLGRKGADLLNGIAEGMRDDEARRLLKMIQKNMGDHKLSDEQGARLQGLLRTEIMAIKMDDVEAFRPPQEWTRLASARHQNVLNAAAEFLTPAQVQALTALSAVDLAERERQMARRRAAFGLN